MLWFVGSADDVHIQALGDTCRSRGVEFGLLGRGTTSAFSPSSSMGVTSTDTVLWRFKSKGDAYSSLSANVIDHFANSEWLHYLEGACLASGAQVLDGASAATANNKLYQLRLARQLGFKVPEYLASNDREELLGFFERMGPKPIIKKPFRATSLPDVSRTLKEDHPRKWFGVSRITAADLAAADAEDVARCPVFVQEEIVKAYELRIIVVEDAIICIKIDSQSRPEAALDWRLGHSKDMYSLSEVDDPIADLLQRFRREIGLFSGVFDLIVAEDGEIYFLECNPHGQWIFHDHVAPGLVAETFVKAIEERMRRHAATRPGPRVLVDVN